MGAFEEHLRKFRTEDLSVYNGSEWTAVVRQKQITLGSLVILLRRPEAELSGLTSVESTQLFEMVGVLQDRLKSAFSPDRFNLIAAMMKDPWVHFHLIPRYNGRREFAGATWDDADWPAVAAFREVQTGDETLAQIRRRLSS